METLRSLNPDLLKSDDYLYRKIYFGKFDAYQRKIIILSKLSHEEYLLLDGIEIFSVPKRSIFYKVIEEYLKQELSNGNRED